MNRGTGPRISGERITKPAAQFSGKAKIRAVQKPELQRRDLRGRQAFGARITEEKQMENEKQCTAAEPLHERSKANQKPMGGELSERNAVRTEARQ
jgi:hypothetical protein